MPILDGVHNVNFPSTRHSHENHSKQVLFIVLKTLKCHNRIEYSNSFKVFSIFTLYSHDSLCKNNPLRTNRLIRQVKKGLKTKTLQAKSKQDLLALQILLQDNISISLFFAFVIVVKIPTDYLRSIETKS